MHQLCPLCRNGVQQSDYLAGVFGSDYFALQLANLVTHYRHGHVTSYDKTWRNWRYASKVPGYGAMGHEAYKSMFNNRAKRQLMRGIFKSDLPHDEKVGLISACARLQDNEAKTVELMEKLLSKLSMVKP